MKKTSLFLLVLIMILASFAGCQKAEEVQVVEAPTEVITEAPTEAPTEVPAEEIKIISTVPSVTEILFALGCDDKIVGVDSYSTYPEATSEIEKVGDYSGFNIEKVISLEPTVVFAGNKLQQEEIDTLVDLGINVIETEPTGFEDITTSITEIGAIVGKADEAKELTDSINVSIEEIQMQAGLSSYLPTIYYVMSIGENNNWTSGEGSFINTAMAIAGGLCITNGPDMEPWMNYPLEDLILADPDILIVSQWVTEADLLADPTYAELTAVKEGKYYFINPDIIERPGPRIIEGLSFIQECITGE